MVLVIFRIAHAFDRKQPALGTKIGCDLLCVILIPPIVCTTPCAAFILCNGQSNLGYEPSFKQGHHIMRMFCWCFKIAPVIVEHLGLKWATPQFNFTNSSEGYPPSYPCSRKRKG